MNAQNINWRPVIKTDGLFIMDPFPHTLSGTLGTITSETLESQTLGAVDEHSDSMSIDDDIDENAPKNTPNNTPKNTPNNTPTEYIISLVNTVLMDMDYSPESNNKSSPKAVICEYNIPINTEPITFRNFMPYDEIGWKNRKLCFSLTYPGVIRVGGITYTSLYHYIVSRKARLYSYFGIYKAISKMTHSPCYPDEGWFEHEYRIKNYDSAITTDYLWDLHYNEVLRCGLNAKFTQINAYRRILDETGNNKLIYESDDAYLGSKIVDGVVVGENRLGEMLMRLREKLRRA